MSVNDFVTFTIQVNNAGVTQEGFGTALVLSYNADWAERVRTYSSISEVADDFDTDQPEYINAAALFAQAPRVEEVKIGRCTLAPTMKYGIAAITVANNYAYTIQVDGEGITSTAATYTSDASATASEIHNGLKTALNAVVGKNYLAAFSPKTSLTPMTFTAANASEIFTSAGHGLQTGDGPVWVSNSGGALPSGLAISTDYYVIRIDANTFYLATSLANALAGTNLLISTDGTGTQTLTPQASCVSPYLGLIVTATGAGAGKWFSLECKGNAQYLSNAMTHADPGVATDLAAIALEDPEFYCVINPWGSKAVALATAGWTETNSRIYFCSSVNSDSLNVVVGSGTDALAALFALGYKRTIGKYHPSPIQAFDAASAGCVLSKKPGKWTEAFKSPSGVTAITLTSTQKANLKARRAGTITTEKGRKITWDGKVFDTTYAYLDIVVAVDWLSDAVQSAAFGVMVAMDKVSYTDEDIDTIAGAVRGVLSLASSDAHNVLDPGDPADDENLPPSIAFPRVSAISAATRALRILPNGVIRGRFQGAVQEVQFEATLTF